MSIAHQYTADGYYAGSVEDYGFLPVNATYTKPLAEKDGFVQKWNGNSWEYVENHKGKTGYIEGKPFEMKQYGPLPEGFCETPPTPTDEELSTQIRAERNKRIAETDYLVMPDYPISPESEKDIRRYRQDLRDITMQGGFPHEINWPKMPEIH